MSKKLQKLVIIIMLLILLGASALASVIYLIY